jgi:hypothetical protein
MASECSLPHSQLPATCPYSKPARSTPYPLLLLKIHLNIYLPIYVWVSLVASLLQVSPPKPCINFFSPPYALHARPSNSSRFYHPNNIGWGIQLLVKQLLPLPCYLAPPKPKIFFSGPYSQIPSACVPPSMSATKFHTHKNNRQYYSYDQRHF